MNVCLIAPSGPTSRATRTMLAIRHAIAAALVGGLSVSAVASHASSPRARQADAATRPLLYAGLTLDQPTGLGETHRYDVVLDEGAFFELRVSQDRVLVTLSLLDADGEALRSVDIPDIDPFPQRLMFKAPASGRLTVGVSVHSSLPLPSGESWLRGNTPPPGYVLQVVALRSSRPDDDRRLAWFDAMTRAEKLARAESMATLQQSIPLLQQTARDAADPALEATTLEMLARLTAYFTELHASSLAARERLTELYPLLGERQGEITNLRRLAMEYSVDGRLGSAKDAASRALEMSLSRGFVVNVALSQRDLGVYEFHLGNYERARELGQRAQSAAAAFALPSLEAVTWWDLARLDELAGDLDAAVARCRRGLELAKGNRGVTSLIMLWLGFLYLSRGELDDAASQFEARLDLTQFSVQRDEETLARVGLGDVLLARGDRTAARQRYESAAAALEKGAQPFRCMVLQRLGRLDIEDGRLSDAMVRFETIRAIAAARHDPQCEAAGLGGVADLAMREGEFAAAEVNSRRVVELMEGFREAAVSLESRSLGFGALAPAYERAIETTMRRAGQGDTDAVGRALTLNEQALARGLLDRVLEGRLDRTARAPKALVDQRREVRERWRARLAELDVAMRRHPDADATRALADETAALDIEARDLDARMDAADARQATFVRPHPLSAAAIQALLDRDTVLLEYGLGEARSYLWVVSASGVNAFTLAPRAQIEALARTVHEGLARPPGDAGTRGRPLEADRRELSRLVIEPAASLIEGKRLVLVLTGALSLVPFGALPVPRDPGDDASDAALLSTRHEIVQVPSATILGSMRALMSGRSRPAKTAAVFADPIYDIGDPRVRISSASVAARSASRRPDSAMLARLPFSRGEAEAIASLAPGRVATFLGADATRERVLGEALADYRFVHFATHGILNQQLPSLSSLAFSLVDAAGRPHDGLLRLPDIYDMTLNADVVVLSGCQTALGKDVRGEGPIGLARAFMYAGAPRVVASLWQVDDLATAELMQRFYRGMLVSRLSPAAALHRAQRQLAASSRWSAPYFWAGFVLEGDWR